MAAFIRKYGPIILGTTTLGISISSRLKLGVLERKINKLSNQITYLEERKSTSK